MELGITMLITAESMSAADLGRAAEERGFESLFLPEHTHIPVNTDPTRFPYGTQVPELFRHMVDPLIGNRGMNVAAPIDMSISMPNAGAVETRFHAALVGLG